jgi:Ser/Thr protein kinase RdoA (MazF antagonist)
MPLYIEEAERLERLAIERRDQWLEVHKRAAAEGGFVHGDMGQGNLVLVDSAQFILDWNSWSQALRWQNDLTFVVRVAPPRLIASLLREYHRECPIPAVEAEVLPLLFSPAFELMFVLSGEWASQHRLRALERRGLARPAEYLAANHTWLSQVADGILALRQ